MIVYNARRQPVTLGAEVGRGGEAAVYKLAVQPALLAKIYHRPARPDYEHKLAWMQSHPPDDPTQSQGHASIAWPHDLLYTSSGQLVGYVMVHVQNAVPVLQVFNPRLRAKTLPSFNRRYLHRTARNLAAALGALHASQYVVGDLNESNIMVTPSALVTIIDADSFQVQRREGSKPVLHPCPVGKPEYTPPELQGKTFSQTARLPEHDRFGLGVLVFQLLMEGSHPFRAQWLGAGEPPPIEDRIRDGHWPYAPRPAVPVVPPPSVPPLRTLHPALVELAQRCFVDGHRNPQQRPTPEEWERAIILAEKALTTCRQGHVYARHLGQCPDCEAEARRAAARPASAARSTTGPAPRPRPRTTVAAGPPLPNWQPLLNWALSMMGLAPAMPQAPPTVTCRRCGHVNPAGEIYCQDCTQPLSKPRPCRHCHRPIPANARYCAWCGRQP